MVITTSRLTPSSMCLIYLVFFIVARSVPLEEHRIQHSCLLSIGVCKRLWFDSSSCWLNEIVRNVLRVLPKDGFVQLMVRCFTHFEDSSSFWFLFIIMFSKRILRTSKRIEPPISLPVLISMLQTSMPKTIEWKTERITPYGPNKTSSNRGLRGNNLKC